MIFQGPVRFVVLGAASVLYFLLMATTFNSLGQALPFMVSDLGMSWAQAGFGFTLLGVACGAASFVPAMMIRVAGVSLTFVAGSAMLVAGFLLMAGTHGVAGYQFGTILLGLGYCFCGTVPCVHIISSIFARRSTALGVYFTAGSLGAVGGPVFFYLVSEFLGGWRTYWTLCAVAALLVGGFAAIVTRGSGVRAVAPEAPALHGWAMKGALLTPQFWVIVAAYTGCLLVNTTVHSFSFQHLMEHGQSKGAATALISLAALVGAAAAGGAGLIGERVEARRLTMLSLGALAVTSATLAIGQGWLMLGLFAVSMGIGLGFSYVSTAMLMQDYFGRRASLELYSIMSAVSTSAAIGPGIGGIVRDRTGSFSPVFFAIAAIDVVLVVAVMALRKPTAALAGAELRPELA